MGEDVEKREVWVFGNPDLESDSLPLRILPELRKRFPTILFRLLDPLEDWDQIPDQLVILDTVQGIEQVMVFHSLEQFEQTPHVTMHDFDLGMKLRWLGKLGKLPPFTLIGLPQRVYYGDVLGAVIHYLNEIVSVN